MFLDGSRSLFLLVFSGCLLGMVISCYLEYAVGLVPSPLCLAQRFCLMGLGALSLLALLHAPGRRGRQLYAGLALGVALTGTVAALRQIWLQAGPPGSLPDCQSAGVLRNGTRAVTEVLQLVLHGRAECIDVSWSLLGMTLPEWSLMLFILLLGLCGWTLGCQKKPGC